MFSKQNILLFLAVVLAGIYVYYFTDWVNRPRIQIIAQTRPIQPRGPVALVYPVSFLLDGQYRLTSVKVVPLSGYETVDHQRSSRPSSADHGLSAVRRSRPLKGPD